MVRELNKRQLQWTGCLQRKEGSLIKLVQAGDHTGKNQCFTFKPMFTCKVGKSDKKCNNKNRDKNALDREQWNKMYFSARSESLLTKRGRRKKNDNITLIKKSDKKLRGKISDR